MIGYISHLTTDEAFRDEVTVHVYGVENWRPVIMGLWSMGGRVLDRQYGHTNPKSIVSGRRDNVGFIDCGVVGSVPGHGQAMGDPGGTPGRVERIFLRLRRCEIQEDEARRAWEDNLRLAGPFLDDTRRMRFYGSAVNEGMAETIRYLEGVYAP